MQFARSHKKQRDKHWKTLSLRRIWGLRRHRVFCSSWYVIYIYLFIYSFFLVFYSDITILLLNMSLSYVC